MLVARDLYVCQNCGQETTPCSCNTAMRSAASSKCARVRVGTGRRCPHGGRADTARGQCAHLLSSWSDASAAREALMRTSGCSFCGQHVSFFLVKRNTMRRSVYKCSACNGLAMPCIKCKDGMAGTWSGVYGGDSRARRSTAGLTRPRRRP